MVVTKCTCVLKNRDSKGNIKSYTLRDENGIIDIITAKQIKDAMNKGQLVIDNLQIDKAGRLVDKKVEHKILGIEKSVDLLKVMEDSLIKGNALTIPKLESNQKFTANEMNEYVPLYLIKPMMKVLEDSPTGIAIKNMCEVLVPMAVRNVENKGYKVETCVIQSRGINIEVYEVAK